MLYVTTRDERETFTAKYALGEKRGKDGGFFLPFREPAFSKEYIDSLSDRSFGQCAADVLNSLFDTCLTGWDVDFCIGRYPLRLKPLGSRILVAETWHNPDWDYARLEKNLTQLLCERDVPAGEWLKIAIRIGVLFAAFGQLLRQGITTADFSFVSGDFTAPISAWYARKWGLPIGNIVCSCNENKSVWDLICYGQMRTDVVAVPTSLPEADVAIPAGLERLIFDCAGREEVRCYLDTCRAGRMYTVSDALLAKLRNHMYVSVVSSSRITETIMAVYRTHDCLMTQSSALAYAGLMDFRSKSAEIRPGIVWSEKSPLHEPEIVSKALGITQQELLQKLN